MPQLNFLMKYSNQPFTLKGFPSNFSYPFPSFPYWRKRTAGFMSAGLGIPMDNR